MTFSPDIVVKQERARKAINKYEADFAKLALADKLYQCQTLNEKTDETSIAKILLLFLLGENEVRFEIKRIFSWREKEAKSTFLINQLNSKNVDVVISAIELTSILKDASAIPDLIRIFNLEDPPLSQAIIAAFGEIDDPLCINTIRKALTTNDKQLLLLAVKTLAKWINDVSWTVFRQLLHHEDRDVRAEAAFAIALRKAPRGARDLLTAIKKETDPEIKYLMIQHSGMIPNKILLRPLLQIMAYDKDQKAKLTASRTLDRLQGLLSPGAIFHLRNHHDTKIRAEILFRLGKFGTDSKRHKKYLRNTLMKSDEQIIVQACLEAIGHIAEHSDITLLSQFLGKDPLSSYNALMALTRTWKKDDTETVYNILQDGLFSAYSATMALTRTWREEDREKVLETLNAPLSATQKQVILKYLTRRRGLSLKPIGLFEAIKKLLTGEDNINVRYLSLHLLEFSPCPEAVHFLLSEFDKSAEKFEKEAIEKAFDGLITKNAEFILSFIENVDIPTSITLMHFIPEKMELSFFKKLSDILFSKYDKEIDGKNIEQICNDMCRVFITKPVVAKQFVSSLPTIKWQRLFLGKLEEYSTDILIRYIKNELIDILEVDDNDVRMKAIKLLISLRDPIVVPHLIAIAESGESTESSIFSKKLIKLYVEEGIL